MYELYKPEQGMSRPRSLLEQVAELEREHGVRSRYFREWVKRGKMSIADAADRFERHAAALETLKRALAIQEVSDEMADTESQNKKVADSVAAA
ncbi:MAG TPA: hypothetical protein VJW55_07730 [Candidatus Angelobacter sp.]|nr:hypothetical protein [Candidatus Angelobacter sp.]